MAKWADYLISQVSYDSNHLITNVKQHSDNGNKISEGEVVDRNVVANNLGHGAKYMTVYGGLGKISIGKNVRYFRAYEHHYIRIDDNKVMSDNLGELPSIDELQQEERPALPETKPAPAVEAKPLSTLSSAFFAEPAEATPEPAEVIAEATPEPAEVIAEATPEPAEVIAEATPEPAKQNVTKTKVSSKKKSSRKKVSSKKKSSRKKVSSKKKSSRKKVSSKKKSSRKKVSSKKKSSRKKRA